MLVSWTWLSRYLDLPMTPAALADALSLSGLNHESTAEVGDDVVIDLEVTSNRGDCLGHIGVAREIAVLYDLPLKLPTPQPAEASFPVTDFALIRNDFPAACPRYTARVIRGVKIGSSPAWLADSLRSIGLTPVNNVVDVTNYVMMECGQPLHAFDLAAIADNQIVVRPGKPGEQLEAIDHRTYQLDAETCVIADAERALAIAGVMGGAGSEVTAATTDLLLEAAIFTPLNVRRSARGLKLHSPSSYRFERRVDPAGVDWASRRACQLILETAGGELASGLLDSAPQVPTREPVVLRLAQIERILGIQIDREEVIRILSVLGCGLQPTTDALTIDPPSWRHDLTREADMIEEVARIHGYDKIPEDSPIPVAPSARRDFDTAMDRVRQVLLAGGISEAMTPSIVTSKLDTVLSPWTERAALQTETPLLKGATCLRRSLLPSLLQSRADNWSAASWEADLYEVAHIYLPGATPGDLPEEQYSVGLVCGQDFFHLKGLLEAMLRSLGSRGRLVVASQAIEGLDRELSVALHLDSNPIGYLGQVSKQLQQKLKLPGQTCVAELSLPAIFQGAQLVPQFQPVSPFPMISRDLNLIVSEAVRWIDLETSTRAAGGAVLACVRYQETYRAPEKDGEGTKRILFSVDLQRQNGTLTGSEADDTIEAIVQQCQQDHAARLLA